MHVKKRELLGTTWGMAVINLRHVFAQQVIRVLKKWMKDVMTLGIAYQMQMEGKWDMDLAATLQANKRKRKRKQIS